MTPTCPALAIVGIASKRCMRGRHGATSPVGAVSSSTRWPSRAAAQGFAPCGRFGLLAED